MDPPPEEDHFSFFNMGADQAFTFEGIPSFLHDDPTLDPSSLTLSTIPKGPNSHNDLLEQKAPAGFGLQDPYDESLSDSSSSKRTSSGPSSKRGTAEPDAQNDTTMEYGVLQNAPPSPSQMREMMGGHPLSIDTPPLEMDTSFDTPPLEMDSAFDASEFLHDHPFDLDRASTSPVSRPPQVTANRRPVHRAKSRPKNKSSSSTGASVGASPQSTSFAASNASSPMSPGDFRDPTPSMFMQADPSTMFMRTPNWPAQFSGGSDPMRGGPNAMHHAFVNAPNPMATSSAMMLAPYSNFMPMPHGMNVAGPFLSFDKEGMPPRTRVETQIHLKTVFGQLPPGVSKLHLPKHTISKPKLWSKVPYVPSPDTLNLQTMLVCTGAMENEEWRKRAFKRARDGPNSGLGNARPDEEDDADKPLKGGEVWICTNCIERERKRAERKKIKKPDEEGTWKAEEWRRAVVFNTNEIKELPKPDPQTGHTIVELPMRIACYCRHQQEKLGFQVIFTITDHLGRVLAQELTPSIMITDDHKNHVAPQLLSPSATQPGATKPQAPATSQAQSPQGQASQAQVSPAHLSQAQVAQAQASRAQASQSQTKPNPLNASSRASQSVQPTSFRASQSVSDLSRLQAGPPSASRPLLNPGAASAASRSLSRPASPSSLSGPNAKKRKSSSGKVPVSMAMTPLDTVAPGAAPGKVPEAQSASTPPFLQGGVFNPSDSTFAGGSPSAGGSRFGATPSTPGMEDHPLFSPSAASSAAMEQAFAPHGFSASRSAHASRAPSPNSFANVMNTAALQTQFAHRFNAGSDSDPAATWNPMGTSVPSEASEPMPTISRITPAEGSKLGGYEVTILGENLHRGLEVMFGSRKAMATWYWAENIILCVVPASPVAGDVAVTFSKQPPGVSMLNPHKFRYLDDDEDKLLRSAMEVLARKMNGNLGDVKDFAMSILNYRGLPPNHGGVNGGGSSGQGYGNAAGSSAPHDIESQLMKCLELIDLDDSPHRAQWDYKISSGHTMLHMACSLGFHRFAAGLVARGANVDVHDNSGFTPLHFAALNNHPEIVRRLLLAGADSTAKSLGGMMPADVARSDDIIADLRRVARRTRSLSVGCLRSAPSSTTSLKSLWGQTEPMSPYDRARDDSDVEYSSFDSSDSDEQDRDADEEDEVLEMRRPSIHSRRSDSHLSQRENGDNLLEPPPSPNAAAAAFRQFQQAMAIYVQSLPQLPHMPQMPQMPALPRMGTQADNQMPLYYAQFIRQLTALVPGKAGPRPATPESEADKAMGIRGWWNRSWVANDTLPPPSYEDLYPGREVDSKARSAEEAFAMQPPMETKRAVETTTEAEAVEVAEEVSPANLDDEVGVLTIGRKNAITKEQQRDILRAHQVNFKRLSSDRNLFIIWIPLLVVVAAALLYGHFPEVSARIGQFIYSLMGPRTPAHPDSVTGAPGLAVEV
ncbi:uncharacterized protein DNG_06079 [Cephalotrichum gorgonifer]|uniref:IPT/TIG domain-containing protein n=1 Tax=Cephalotrichum gorgonifer TaxID=2041049 RepID=A0AAE8MYZ4_9PEZI|nr:uncharacterized protein DNG_06079 [Cephalotrichum gorgonifer]